MAFMQCVLLIVPSSSSQVSGSEGIDLREALLTLTYIGLVSLGNAFILLISYGIKD